MTRLLRAALLTVMTATLATAAPLRVALVFDDGPMPKDAVPLLALLAKEQVAVTFSLVGQLVHAHPETVRAMADAGHEIANHSHTHAAIAQLDPAGIEREVTAAQSALTTVLGQAPRWYWPPYLAVDDRLRVAVQAAGLTIYPTPHLVSSDDWDRAVSAEEIHRRSTTGVRDGSVILFHEWRGETRDQLPAILAELRRQGCTFHTFSGLLESLASAPPVAPGPAPTPAP